MHHRRFRRERRHPPVLPRCPLVEFRARQDRRRRRIRRGRNRCSQRLHSPAFPDRWGHKLRRIRRDRNLRLRRRPCRLRQCRRRRPRIHKCLGEQKRPLQRPRRCRLQEAHRHNLNCLPGLRHRGQRLPFCRPEPRCCWLCGAESIPRARAWVTEFIWFRLFLLRMGRAS